MLDNNEAFWNKSWKKHIETYLKNKPRTGYFIKSYFKNIKTVLEIAGGSCRDGRYLANKGFDATGSDFNKKILNYLKEKFPNDKLKYSCDDAFGLSFQDNSFELIFHNGFFILFNNEDIMKMLKEQARVAKKYIVFFVHNMENKKLLEEFKVKAQKDNLYDIRFFNKKEVVEIVKESGISYKSIKVLKFGGFYDSFFRKKLKKIIPNPLFPIAKSIVPRLYQKQKWEETERICCIIKIKK